MEVKEVKDIIKAGLAWANWTEEQKEAMKIAYKSVENLNRIEKAYRRSQRDLDKVLSEIFKK